MDPTHDETTGFGDLAAIGHWAQVHDPSYQALITALGTPVSFEDIANIPRAAFVTCVEGLQVGGAAISPLQKGRVEKFRRACLLKCGIDAPETEVQRALAASAAAAAAALLPPAPTPPRGVGVGSPSGRGVKLSQITDQTSEVPLVPLAKDRIAFLFAEYKKAYGAMPAREVEPTAEQLSALHQTLEADSVPYVDFAIWGPFHERAMEKLKYTAQVQVDINTWKAVQYPGPPNFEVWWKCWRVFSVALQILGACTLAAMDQYGELIRHMVLEHGTGCWWLIYAADRLMRQEELERIRRRLHSDWMLMPAPSQPLALYQPDTPWSASFLEAVSSQEGDKFWDREVTRKVVMYLTNIRSKASLMDDGTTLGAVPEGPPAKRSRGLGGGASPTAWAASPTARPQKYSTSRSGNRLCNAYNAGQCKNFPCPKGFAHFCHWCRDAHTAQQCPNPSGGDAGAPMEGSPGKAKGKGQKGKGQKGKGFWGKGAKGKGAKGKGKKGNK